MPDVLLAAERPVAVPGRLPGERAECARRGVKDAPTRMARRSRAGDHYPRFVRARSRPRQRRASDDDAVSAFVPPLRPPDAADLGSRQSELEYPVLQRMAADDDDHGHELTLMRRLLGVLDRDGRLFRGIGPRRQRIFMLGRVAATVGRRGYQAASGLSAAAALRRGKAER